MTNLPFWKFMFMAVPTSSASRSNSKLQNSVAVPALQRKVTSITEHLLVCSTNVTGPPKQLRISSFGCFLRAPGTMHIRPN
ncbi:unnamed protein product [Ixodes pacificus]